MSKNTLGFILTMAVLVAMVFCSACFAAERLPQGNSGIASKYPGDVGIEKDSAVIFTEDFETGTIEQIGQRWGAVKQGRPWGTIHRPKIMSLPNDTPQNSAGKRSLLINAIVDMDVIGTNDTGGYLFTTFEEMDKTYLRFYTKFGLGHGYEHHFVMLGCNKEKLPWPFPKAGTSPKGDDHMYVYIDPIGFGGKYPPPGPWCLYSYWAEMKISADNSYWGNVTKPIDPVAVTPGKWQCVELMIKMNSAPDKRDGEFALWIDGKLSMHIKKGIPRGNWSGMGFDLLESGGEPFEGLLLRTDMDLKINTIWFEHLIGYGAQKANNVKKEDVVKINPVYFDNIVVAKSYIGPVSSKKTIDKTKK